MIDESAKARLAKQMASPRVLQIGDALVDDAGKSPTCFFVHQLPLQPFISPRNDAALGAVKGQAVPIRLHNFVVAHGQLLFGSLQKLGTDDDAVAYRRHFCRRQPPSARPDELTVLTVARGGGVIGRAAQPQNLGRHGCRHHAPPRQRVESDQRVALLAGNLFCQFSDAVPLQEQTEAAGVIGVVGFVVPLRISVFAFGMTDGDVSAPSVLVPKQQ